MAARKKDPTEPIRLRASRYPGVDQGTACAQGSFKAGKKAFLFIGMQGGHYKAMFKLRASLARAKELAREDPDRYQVGSTAWVTARFTAVSPMPKRLWETWLDESYNSCLPTSKQAAATATRPAKTKAAKKQPAARRKK